MKVILIMAQTADGKIARASDELVDWTSKEDKRFFIDKTKEAGVMVMGSNTYRTIWRPLPGRLNVVLTSHPEAEKSESGETEKLTEPESPGLTSLSFFCEFLSQIITLFGES